MTLHLTASSGEPAGRNAQGTVYNEGNGTQPSGDQPENRSELGGDQAIHEAPSNPPGNRSELEADQPTIYEAPGNPPGNRSELAGDQEPIHEAP